jgi:hypothetical protein
LVDGHTKRPRSIRFENRHMPWLSYQSSFTRSPRLPRKANSAPECGLCSRTVIAHGVGNWRADHATTNLPSTSSRMATSANSTHRVKGDRLANALFPCARRQ